MKSQPDILREPSREDVTASAVAGVPFAAYLLAMNLTTVPSAAQWNAADPILRILPPALNLWITPLLALFCAVRWQRLAPLDRAKLRRHVLAAVAGVGVAAAVALALRGIGGGRLPAFVPPEESAAPGFLLSMTAGFGEEVLFRLMLLPAVFFLARRELGRITSLFIAAGTTALGFALLHEMGSPAFEAHYFVTRLAFPGIMMSIAWYLNPTFIVVAHCTAHLLIPLLFVA